MANDVQLEFGHVRIANRLYEALLDADFTATQFKILHGLIRLTYGWSKKTVSISQADLAATIGLRPTGTFRAALRELVVEGVVLCPVAGAGHERATYAIQKDFTQWGRWTIAPERLARRYGTRPQHRDDLLAKPDAPKSDIPADVKSDDVGCLHSGTPTETPAQKEAGRVPLIGQADRLHLGRGEGSNSLQDGESEGPKAIDSQRQPTTERENSARATAMADEAALLDRRIDRAKTACGDAWPDVDAFLRSRLVHTWPAWLNEFAKLLTGTRYVPADLGGACSDALALDRPIDGPHAIRAFVAKRHSERLAAEDPGRNRRAAGAVARLASAERRADDAGEILADLRSRIVAQPVPGQGVVRSLPRAKVEELGPEVTRAVDAVGGVQAILNTPPEKLSFLARDFGAALARARETAA